MKMIWTLSLAAALVAWGCNQGGQGGGGGNAPPVQQTRDHLGEAYVQAARTHADVVRGDYNGAADAIKQMRNQLNQAKQTARLDNQARINELDQEAINVQRAITRRSLNGYQATGSLVRDTEALLSAWAPPAGPQGGGAGTGSANQPGSPMEGATPYSGQPNQAQPTR